MVFSVSISILVILLCLWCLWRKHQFSHFKRLGIPGPPPNLLFGNMLELYSKSTLECHKEWIQKYGKVVGYYLGLHPVLIVADPDLLKQIEIRDFHKFINRPPLLNGGKSKSSLDNSLIRLRGKRWKEVRSTVSPSFTTSKMKMMYPIIGSAIDDLMENVKEKVKVGKPFNIYPLFQGLTMDVIGRTAFGIKTEAQRNPKDRFLKNARIIIDKGNTVSILTLLSVSFPGFESIFHKLVHLRIMFADIQSQNPLTALTEICGDVLASRRRNPTISRADLLQLMIESKVLLDDKEKITAEQLTAGADNESFEKIEEKNGVLGKKSRNMTDDEIKANTLLFFLAGYESTSISLAFMAHFLVNHPEIQERIRDEVKTALKSQDRNICTMDATDVDYWCVQKIPYLDQVLTETLRMYPPVAFFINREAAEDIQYEKIRIPRGSAVHVPVYLLHHDPEFWDEPETFNPDRFSADNKAKLTPLAWQAFGAGPRNCAGQRFAQMEAKLAISRLLQKYRFVACDETEKKLTLKVTATSLTPRNGVVLRAEPL